MPKSISDIDRRIGSRLRRRRTSLGLSQAQVGLFCPVRFQQIQNYECGQSSISAAKLWMLANALGVSPTYFFEDCSSEPSSVV